VIQLQNQIVPSAISAWAGRHPQWKSLLRAIAVTVPLVVMVRTAIADESMRCGNWIVAVPVSAEELLRKCGEPLKREVTTEDIHAPGRSGVGSRTIGTTTIEKWTYNSDGQSLPMIVTVVDGKVTRIDREK
jgi:Protein of unknown function (DUF2845)